MLIAVTMAVSVVCNACGRDSLNKEQKTETIVHEQGLEVLKEYDYVAIFDADFKPDTDFLVSLRLLFQLLAGTGFKLWQHCFSAEPADITLICACRWPLSPTSLTTQRSAMSRPDGCSQTLMSPT